MAKAHGFSRRYLIISILTMMTLVVMLTGCATLKYGKQIRSELKDRTLIDTVDQFLRVDLAGDTRTYWGDGVYWVYNDRGMICTFTSLGVLELTGYNSDSVKLYVHEADESGFYNTTAYTVDCIDKQTLVEFTKNVYADAVKKVYEWADKTKLNHAFENEYEDGFGVKGDLEDLTLSIEKCFNGVRTNCVFVWRERAEDEKLVDMMYSFGPVHDDDEPTESMPEVTGIIDSLDALKEIFETYAPGAWSFFECDSLGAATSQP